MNVVDPWTDHVILAYMELLAQNNFSSVTVKNHLSVLSHYFQLYSWPIQGLQSRQVLMFVRSLKYNGLVKPKVKGVLNMVMLQQLVDLTLQRLHADTLVPLYLLSFFGFFRLASLVPPSIGAFDDSRFPLVQDLVWAKPGLHFILKCSKTMQALGQFKVVQIPKLPGSSLCPVTALQKLIKVMKLQPQDPLFVIHHNSEVQLLTTFKVRNLLAKSITDMNLDPRDYGFHMFRRSGATLAHTLQVPLPNIKQHGQWKSEAIYTYLKSTTTADAVVPLAFQQHIVT